MDKIKNRFLYDLARGGKAETIVVTLLTEAGFPSAPDKKARSEWDVKSTYGQACITTEVKYDAYEKKSGNVAIEVFNPRLGRPSGVTATKAFFWAHVLFDGAVWLTPVSTLKEYIDNSAPGRIIDIGGDKNATLWLYPSKEILPGAFARRHNVHRRIASVCHRTLGECSMSAHKFQIKIIAGVYVWSATKDGSPIITCGFLENNKHQLSLPSMGVAESKYAAHTAIVLFRKYVGVDPRMLDIVPAGFFDPIRPKLDMLEMENRTIYLYYKTKIHPGTPAHPDLRFMTHEELELARPRITRGHYEAYRAGIGS